MKESNRILPINKPMIRLDGIKHYYLFMPGGQSPLEIRKLISLLRHMFDLVESVYEIKRSEPVFSRHATHCPGSALSDSVFGVAWGLQREESYGLRCFSQATIEYVEYVKDVHEAELQLGRTRIHAEAESVRILHNALVRKSSFIVEEENAFHVVCPQYIFDGIHPEEQPLFAIDGEMEAERIFRAARRAQLFYLSLARHMAYLLSLRGECGMAVLITCCGHELVCDEFTNTCPHCGADYNWSGCRLAPRTCWGEETGESVADILGVDGMSVTGLLEEEP